MSSVKKHFLTNCEKMYGKLKIYVLYYQQFLCRLRSRFFILFQTAQVPRIVFDHRDPLEKSDSEDCPSNRHLVSNCQYNFTLFSIKYMFRPLSLLLEKIVKVRGFLRTLNQPDPLNTINFSFQTLKHKLQVAFLHIVII